MMSITLENRAFVVQTFLENLHCYTFMFTIIILLNNLRDYLITFGHCDSQLFLYYACECPRIPE